jgi:hypothetical protein
MALVLPSGTNTFIPGMVQDNLIVGYARNVEDFALNRYIQVVPTPQNQAFYLFVDGAAAARLTNTDLRNMVWPDGQPRPSADGDVAEFEFRPVSTVRRSYEFTVGDLAVDQADWDVIGVNSGFQAQRAMTARTLGVQSALSAAAWGSNTGTATSLGGGFVGTGTATDPRFKKIVNKAAQQIRRATFGAVKVKDLCMIMSPLVAETIAESQEIHTYLKESAFAMAQVRGDAPGQNTNFGLPDVLYGVNLIVDDAVRVTSKRGGTLATVSVVDENRVYFISRPGGLMMPYGGISYSTIQLFVREEMSIEAYPDARNRLRQGFVTDDWGAFVVAPASGYMVTNALS